MSEFSIHQIFMHSNLLTLSPFEKITFHSFIISHSSICTYFLNLKTVALYLSYFLIATY